MASRFVIHGSLIAFGTLLAAFSLVSIVAFTNPATAGVATHGFLYLSIFLLTLGFFMLAGLIIRNQFAKTLYVVNAKHSFRQALLMAIFVTGSLFLKSHDLFAWWVEITLILLLVAVEVFINVN